jgi:uncharacterized protein YndB with AHSA1/START domain
MRMVFRTDIDRPASKVWEFVSRPKYFQKWDDKIESMEVGDEFRLGESFMMNYRWRDKST